MLNFTKYTDFAAFLNIIKSYFILITLITSFSIFMKFIKPTVVSFKLKLELFYSTFLESIKSVIKSFIKVDFKTF